MISNEINKKNVLLDVGMNLTRIGNWVTEDYTSKKKRIEIFFKQTSDDLQSISIISMPTAKSRLAIKRLKQEYPLIESAVMSTNTANPVIAERMLTWGNILTHKAGLIK